jgi:AraC-like DNA-binding protein
VSEAALDKVESSLEQFMLLNKPYLRPGYKLIDLSNDTGIPIYRISAFVNRRKNQNFFGYLNQFRIDYYLEKLASKEYELKTLEAIAEECGFQNRTTFIRVFKSVMGMTPTEYIRKR